MAERINKRVLIIGGGIGGLTTAIALRRAGIDVTVFERVHDMQEVGAGLTLWTNAVRVLEKLGLSDALQMVGTPITRASIRTNHGKVLAETFLDQLANKYGIVTTAVHRADLQAVLLKALGEGVVQFGVDCVGFTENERGVVAQLADGREEQGDSLIGADGIHSVILAQLSGEAKPRYARYTAWRGVTRFEHPRFPSGITFESWGRVYWFATCNAPEGEREYF